MQGALKKHRSDYRRYCDGRATQQGITCQSELLLPRSYECFFPGDKENDRSSGEANINEKPLEAKISKKNIKIFSEKRFPSLDFTKLLEPVLNGNGQGDTNSKIHLDLEQPLNTRLETISQQLQTDECSMCRLESNIQFFKVTVQEILDNFFTSMQDFDHYRERFHEILEKNQNDSLAEMEQFIKDMIQHITSSEVREDASGKSTETLTKASTKDLSKTVSKAGECADNYIEEVSYFGSTTITHSGAFQLVGDDNSSLRSNKYRSHSSQLQVPCTLENDDKKVVSAENFSRIMSKKQELDKYLLQGGSHDCVLDRDIPVKVSSARKDIQVITNIDDLNTCDTNATQKSFMSRICGYLCKVFRR